MNAVIKAMIHTCVSPSNSPGLVSTGTQSQDDCPTAHMPCNATSNATSAPEGRLGPGEAAKGLQKQSSALLPWKLKGDSSGQSRAIEQLTIGHELQVRKKFSFGRGMNPKVIECLYWHCCVIP